MFKTLYPNKNSSLFSQDPEKNTSQDQILDLLKFATGEPTIEGDESTYYPATYNSRILIQFDLSEVSSSIASGKINGTSQFYLVLKSAHSINLANDYSIYAYPVSGSWSTGRGFANSNPPSSDGVSWKYRDSKLSGTLWKTGSYNSTSTGSYSTIAGGGNWFTSSFGVQSFSHDNPDIRMDVTSIVRQWVSGSIPNNGFMVKLKDSDEFSLEQFGQIL